MENKTILTNEQIDKCFDGLTPCGHGKGRYDIARILETTLLQAFETRKSMDIGQPESWLVTGPYEKVAFADINSADSYCRGLNNGYGENVYSISPLYLSKHSIEPVIEDASTIDESMPPRPELLQLAEDSGAVITGKPDASEPITIVFSIQAWRAFDRALLSSNVIPTMK